MTDLRTVLVRRTRADVPHGVKPEIVVTLYPNATLGLKESGRRRASEVCLDIGKLYVRGVQNRVAVERLTKGKARATERRLRKQLK